MSAKAAPVKASRPTKVASELAAKAAREIETGGKPVPRKAVGKKVVVKKAPAKKAVGRK